MLLYNITASILSHVHYNAIATQWMHLCRIGCLCILLVFAQAVIAEHLADPDCEDECCYLCQSHGDAKIILRALIVLLQ